MSDSHQIAFCTVPDRETAERIAMALVERRLAACVNILPGLSSVYRWQGAVQHDEELLLLIKTRGGLASRLQAAIRELHPYELPEIVAVPIVAGLPDYLHWIDDNLAEPAP
ncbi:divalent-cation tolerance protein CutA [Thiohalobacter sp. IOR34]|uniref:divalent-cation tolerance protein CutA n=1 Tax=Thiohalobacter sp. IOR34 TaxID=3057176 RepID=UPI0025B0EE5E|nr:divalent-cation tolerance protein CutA [Thiohalobacter sp. IOR34]WJW75285.1 divalent-cation tolerance protein CutA [Thiohalobacter sp. IOR34]